jgi:hypothetical protein
MQEHLPSPSTVETPSGPRWICVSSSEPPEPPLLAARNALRESAVHLTFLCPCPDAAQCLSCVTRIYPASSLLHISALCLRYASPLPASASRHQSTLSIVFSNVKLPSPGVAAAAEHGSSRPSRSQSSKNVRRSHATLKPLMEQLARCPLPAVFFGGA